jgi:LemA protein
MSLGLLAALVAAAILVFWMLGAYNRLVALRNAIGAAWQQVDEALARRATAVVPLVTALRAPLAAEGAALDALLAGQAQVTAAADALRERPVRPEATAALVRAESAMSSAGARVLALLDLDAALRDREEVAPLVAQWRESEPRLAFARQLFNEAVQAYNDAAAQWPTRLLVPVYGFGPAGRL